MTTKYLTPEQAASHDLLPFGNASWIRIQLRTGALRGWKVKGRWMTDEAAIKDMVDAGSNDTTRRRRRRSS